MSVGRLALPLRLMSTSKFIGPIIRSLLAVALVALPATSIAATPITGWAWSGNVGWISLHCATDGSCVSSNYGLSKDGAGKVTGYAWSPHIGWISANPSDLAGCPSGTCEFAVSSNGTVSGWLKAINAQTGWDGFISLNGSTFGLTELNGVLTGWAWGDTVTGWVLASADGLCATTAGYYCSGNSWMYRSPSCATTTIIADCGVSGCSSVTNRCVATPPPHSLLASGAIISARPNIVPAGGTTVIIWNVADASSCSITGNGHSWAALSGSATETITESVRYAIACTGAGGTLAGSVSVKILPTWQER